MKSIVPTNCWKSNRVLAASMLSVASLFLTIANAQEIVPIAVNVELDAELTLAWSNTEKSTVIADLSEKLVDKFNDQHKHWQYIKSGASVSAAELAIRTISRGANEILIEIELQLYTKPTPTAPARLIANHVLAQQVLYPPGQFASEGRPSSSEARAHIWEQLEALIKAREEDHGNVLSRNVPVARNPSVIRATDRSLVLPLPRERYSHLAWSEFRLDCVKVGAPGRPVRLSSKAGDDWRPFDSRRPLALVVTITDNLSDVELQALTPKLVYLVKYVEPDAAWLVFGEQ